MEAFEDVLYGSVCLLFLYQLLQVHLSKRIVR